MTPSRYQQAVYDHVERAEASAVVIAVAGSGKTTTLLHALKRIPSTQRTRLLAFNVSIADTLRHRVPIGVHASTFHSAGYHTLRRHLGLRTMEVTADKLRKLTRQLFTPGDAKTYGPLACQLVSLAKGAAVGIDVPNTPDTWQAIFDHHDLYLDGGEVKTLIDLSQQLLARSNEVAEQEFCLDFDDQLYLPIVWRAVFDPYAWVLVDEAQDINPIRQHVVRRLVGDGGHVLAVGDPHQAIYGFTGASTDAITELEEEWVAVRLPLSICYRCARRIVEYAQRWVPHLEPAPDAPPGSIEPIGIQAALSRLEPHDAVLCRTNAPLVELAYTLLGRGIPCTVLGRDLGKGLRVLVERQQAPSLAALLDELSTYGDRQRQALQARGQTAKAQAIADRVACITAVAKALPAHQRTIEGLLGVLDRLFADEVSDRLTLSTVHKAKGREWPKVGILRPDLLPAPWATQPWQQQQERNLQYVAWTRAKETLYLLQG